MVRACVRAGCSRCLRRSPDSKRYPVSGAVPESDARSQGWPVHLKRRFEVDREHGEARDVERAVGREDVHRSIRSLVGEDRAREQEQDAGEQAIQAFVAL